MKICLVGNEGTISFPPLRYGGVEKVIYNIAKELSYISEHEIILFWGDNVDYTETISSLKVCHVKTNKIPMKFHLFSRPRAAYFTGKVANIIGSNKSIIHIHQPWHCYGLTYPSKIKKNIIVFTLHSAYKPSLQMIILKAIHTGYGRGAISDQLQTWFCLKNSDSVTYVSNATRNILYNSIFLKSIVLKSRQYVISNCIDINQYKCTDSIEEEYILYVGRLSKQKGLYILLKSFECLKKILPNIKLILASPVDNSYECRNLLYLIYKLNVEKRIIIVNNPSITKLRELYARSMFIVVPSIVQEAFSLVILEAWASSKAVIATRIGGIPEVITNNKTGILIDPNNPLALYEAMYSLATDKTRRIYLGQLGYKELINKYSVKNIALQYLKVYKSTNVQLS